MTQTIETIVASGDRSQILCCYINATSKVQIVRIAPEQSEWFERVVFPGQRLMFEALPAAQLEIHTSQMASVVLTDRIPCDRLQVHQSLNSSGEYQSARKA